MPAIAYRSLRSLLARIANTSASSGGADRPPEINELAARQDLSLQALEAIHAGAVCCTQPRKWVQTLEKEGDHRKAAK